MNSHPPLTDWRECLNGIRIAAINEHGIKRISTGKDAEAQSAIERIGERQQIKRERAA